MNIIYLETHKINECERSVIALHARPSKQFGYKLITRQEWETQGGE